jgi:hypothetical protein
VDHFFSLNADGDLLSTAVEGFRKALREEGIDMKALSIDIYPKIARRMGVRAFERQQDVSDFIDYLAQNAAED